MTNKRKILILFILLGIGSGLYTSEVRALYYDISLNQFNVDKTQAWNQENITIDATWVLRYSIPSEHAYITILIYNSTGAHLWESESDDRISANDTDWFSDSWEVNISSFTNYSGLIYISFRLAYRRIPNPYDFDNIHTRELIVQKRNATINTYGIESELEYGPHQDFTAFFKNESGVPLVNQLVYVRHDFNDSHVVKSFSTNSEGALNVVLFNLSVGYHSIGCYIAPNDPYYHSPYINTSFYVKKVPIQYLLNGYSSVLNPNTDLNDDFIFEMMFNYKINETIYYLSNYYLSFELFSGDKFLDKAIYRTDAIGKASFVINKFNLHNNNDFRLTINLNGTSIMEEGLFTLDITVETPVEPLVPVDNFVLIIVIITSFIISFSIVSLYLYKNNKTKNRKLIDITIKY